MASLIPFNPSEHIINISLTPRFLSSFKTLNQYLADSFSPTHIPNTSLNPSGVTPLELHKQLS